MRLLLLELHIEFVIAVRPTWPPLSGEDVEEEDRRREGRAGGEGDREVDDLDESELCLYIFSRSLQKRCRY